MDPEELKEFPKRKRLYHRPPSWVGLDAIFFITICCHDRGSNVLCVSSVSERLLKAADYYHSHGRWYLLLFVLMPDHLHLLVAFPLGQQIGQVIRSWKIYTSRQTKVKWQRDFFEHRLRSEESLEQKANYILENPVRAGLIEKSEDWLHKVGSMLRIDRRGG
jgi:REP-associated tyrosine transposase